MPDSSLSRVRHRKHRSVTLSSTCCVVTTLQGGTFMIQQQFLMIHLLKGLLISMVMTFKLTKPASLQVLCGPTVSKQHSKFKEPPWGSSSLQLNSSQSEIFCLRKMNESNYGAQIKENLSPMMHCRTVQANIKVFCVQSKHVLDNTCWGMFFK